MNELLELLGLAESVQTMTDSELSEYRDNLAAAVAEVDLETIDDAGLETLETAAEVAQTVRTELEARETAANERAERARAAIAAVAGSDDEGDDAVAEAEGDLEGDAEAEGAETTETEVETEGTEVTADAEGTDVADEAPVAVAASSKPKIGRVAARRPASARPAPAPAPDLESWNLTASANMSGKLSPGERLDTPDKIAEAFLAAFDSTQGYVSGPPQKVAVARARTDAYPEHLRLTQETSGDTRKVQEVQKRIRQAGGLQAAQALTASGGPCAPSEVRYDLPVLGTDQRPVRDDMLVRFNATRGGVTTVPPPVLTDVAGSVSIWDDDANGGAGQTSTGGSVKPCLSLTCPNEDETIVDAITRCLEFGNFRRSYFPEQVEAWLSLATTYHARIAENNLLAQIASDCTAVTAATVLGTTRNVLSVIDRAAAGFRSRHRTAANFPLRFGAPFWLRDNIRTDLARELPGSSDERLAVADATIDSFFAVRNISVTWFLDGESGQVFPAQAAGTLRAWPSTVITYLYPDGEFLFLDGGVLDLGIVRDSTLNSQNDVQLFAETFEAAHHHGSEALRITIDICPDGSSSAAIDIDPCTTGS